MKNGYHGAVVLYALVFEYNLDSIHLMVFLETYQLAFACFYDVLQILQIPYQNQNYKIQPLQLLHRYHQPYLPQLLLSYLSGVKG
ncbi:Uncharacterised protein [Providencia rettgeri]|nr:Uncharacterised protein [Providencia rettgeri]